MMEGHGREEISDKVDISKTVGWFTSMYPVVIETSEDIFSDIVYTKEMFRKIPNKGISFGSICGYKAIHYQTLVLIISVK